LAFSPGGGGIEDRERILFKIEGTAGPGGEMELYCGVRFQTIEEG
jgi:hypothetical protein